MYRASDAFMAEIKKSARVEHVRGSINGVPFDDSNILTLGYSNRSSDSKDVSLGYCYIGQISATFVGVNIARGNWRDSVIELEYGLELPDGTTEYIPNGTYHVSEATWSDVGVNITASDNMSKLDRAFTIDQTTGMPFDLLKLASTNCFLTLGVTREEVEAMPNGTEVLGLYPNNDIKTYRDFVAWIAQVLGGFATASRKGKLLIKSYANAERVDTLRPRDRISGSVFSDYTTLYDGISIVEIDSKETKYYSVNGGQGSVINLGSNPLLQYGTEDVRTEQRMRLARVARSVHYTPFNISVLNTPVYDLGDIIANVGGVAGDSTIECCVMSIDWSFKELTAIAGFGSDPSLSSGKSKTDKQINGIMQSAADEMISYTFVNATEIELEKDIEVSIINISFATVNPKTIDFLAEIDLECTLGTDEDIQIEARYYSNGTLVPEYQPKTSWNNDGMHLMHLMSFLETLEANTSYDFEVRLILKSGEAKIAPQHIHASVKGQGLAVVDAWDGKIKVADSFSVSHIGKKTFPFNDSSIDIHMETPVNGGVFKDVYDFEHIGGAEFNFTDEMRMTTEIAEFNLVDDEGNLYYTDDDNYYVTDR